MSSPYYDPQLRAAAAEAPPSPPRASLRSAGVAVLLAAAVVGGTAYAATSRPTGSAASAPLNAAAAAGAAQAESSDTGVQVAELHLMIYRRNYMPLSQHTLDAYGIWDAIVEPHCPMHLQLKNALEHEDYQWKIQDDSTGDVVKQVNGSHIVVEFPNVNRFYNISISRSGGGGVMQTKAMSKYVRRELKTLTDNDREAFLEAVHTIYTVSQSDGEAMYGDDFTAHAQLVGMHNSNVYTFHGNLVFMTSHPAFQLKFENSLRSINPSVQVPYWDFMQDAALGAEWPSAQVYQDDWFGSVNNPDGRPSGRFREVQHVYDPNTAFSDSNHNAYGFLSTRWNVGYTKNLTRTNYVCGFPGGISFSTGQDMRECFRNYTSLYKFDMCLEHDVHANLHNMHAGLMDCPVDWLAFAEDNEDWLPQDLISYLSYEIGEAIINSEHNFVQCPSTCTYGVDNFTTCHCYTDFVSHTDEIDDWDANSTYRELKGWFEAMDVKVFQTNQFINYDDEAGVYKFKNMDNDQNLKVMQLMLKTMARPGWWGPMGSGAAANDPIFFVMHQVFEKAQHAMRLSPLYNPLNMTWKEQFDDDAATGVLEGWNSATPFKADIFYSRTEHAKNQTLTNNDIWHLLDPQGHGIPHIFDQFTEWGTITFDPWSEGPRFPV